MHKVVFSVFKAIMLSMIFVFVWDIGFYLYRVTNLNQRMNSLMTSMQKVVMENNYLPEDAYNTYVALFRQVMDSYNNNGDTSRGDFINGFNINYNHECSSERRIDLNAKRDGVDVDILRTQMDREHMGNYGDVMVVDVEVNVNIPIWGFTDESTTVHYASGDKTMSVVDGGENGAAAWHNDGDSALQPANTTLNYTYYVPCMKYQTVGD